MKLKELQNINRQLDQLSEIYSNDDDLDISDLERERNSVDKEIEKQITEKFARRYMRIHNMIMKQAKEYIKRTHEKAYQL